jgi:hypothetical protein
MEGTYGAGITELSPADRNSLQKTQETKQALWRFLGVFRSYQQARMRLISDIAGAIVIILAADSSF